MGQRLIGNLSGSSKIAPEAPGPGILVARNVTPSDTALLDCGQTLAIVTEEGGSAGHAAILARALNLVAVAGVKDVLSHVRDGDWLVVDGATGELLVDPDEETLGRWRRRMDEERLERERLASLRELPAVTPDGFRIVLEANIADPGEAGQALAAGAEGVGVFRTEYLFVNRRTPPSEEEQFEAYREVLSKMAPRRVVVRTMDIGGDKEVACWRLPEEPNPALGMRGIRLSFARIEDFRCQLRALVRAADAGNLAILLPMITGVEEVRRARALIHEIHGESIPLGIMIETPAAALLAGELAQEADFFSIGTNDLIQYVLAADRMSQFAGSLYQPFHPAVLRLMNYVALVARQSGKRVAVCGEMAADPLATPLFIAMEMDELSMSPAAIPAIKDAIRGYHQSLGHGPAEPDAQAGQRRRDRRTSRKLLPMEEPIGMFARTVKIRNKTGLHVRPAGLFVETANKFRSAVQVATADQEADGRSMLSLMLLELTPGTEITIRAEGEDEAEAAGELATLVESGFSE